jgi:glycosyltransferase involved in cell wall biosynthesis
MPDVILPVLDEAAAIPGVLAAMPAGYRPIVVDNGSTDGSAEIARGLGAVVVEEPTRGFGAACFAGLRAAEAKVVCFMDCDGSLDPADLPSVVALLDHADLAIGARRATRGAWPLHARLANRILARELRRRTGVELEDIGPMRAARRLPLLRLDLRDRRSGWPLEMVVRATAAGWTIADTPVPYTERQGRSKVTGTVRGTLQAIGDMSAILRTVE